MVKSIVRDFYVASENLNFKDLEQFRIIWRRFCHTKPSGLHLTKFVLGLLREDMDLSGGWSGRSPHRIADRCAELQGND